jgi:hypothetical protein
MSSCNKCEFGCEEVKPQPSSQAMFIENKFEGVKQAIKQQ